MTGRFIWITEQERDDIALIYALQPPDVVGVILARYDTAPRDPVAAAQVACRGQFADAEATVRAVELILDALGRPR